MGDASFGIVGTASRWLVPRLVADLRARAPGIRLRVNESASERLVAEILAGELAQAIVTEPVQERRLVVETLLEEALVAVVPEGSPIRDGPVPLDALAPLGLVLPPVGNPLRTEVEHAAAERGVTLPVTVEVEGIRLIGDLVAAGAGASVLPQTAVPTELTGVRIVALAEVPPGGSRWSAHATRRCRSPTARCATASARSSPRRRCRSVRCRAPARSARMAR